MKLFTVATILVVALRAQKSHANVKPDGTDGLCLNNNRDCTHNMNACCDALVCSGSPTAKFCVEPPVCLANGDECSGKTRCCKGKCTLHDETNVFLCQEAVTIGSTLLGESAPSGSLNVRNLLADNLLTTTVPGQDYTTSVGCSTGDPHSKYCPFALVLPEQVCDSSL